MSNPCECPPFEGSFEELIISFGLLGKKEESKNCCEEAGYICPNLDKALRHAQNRRYVGGNNAKTSTTPKKYKEVTKKRLTLRPSSSLR